MDVVEPVECVPGEGRGLGEAFAPDEREAGEGGHDLGGSHCSSSQTGTEPGLC